MSVPGEGAAAPGRRMGRNVRWVLLGNVVYALGQWVQLMVFARLGGPSAVGAYAFALALTAPAMMFSWLQLRMLLASDQRDKYQFQEYRRLRVATTLAALATIAVSARLTADWRAVWPVLLPVCALRAADSLTDIYYALWQRHERMGINGGGLMLSSVVSVASMVLLAKLGCGAPGAAAGAALGSCAALALVHFRTRADPELRSSLTAEVPFHWRRLGRLAVEAAPLGAIVLLGSLLQNAPRYFIQHQAGDAALGLFAAAAQLTAAGTIVVGALGSAATPRLARQFAGRDATSFAALTRKLALAGAVLAILGVSLSALVGRRVLMLLFRPEFGAAAPLLVVLAAAAGLGFVATLFGYVLTAARVIAIQPILLGVTLAVAVACCAILVPRQGAMGAAWALVIASLVQMVWSAVVTVRLRVAAPPQGRSVNAA